MTAALKLAEETPMTLPSPEIARKENAYIEAQLFFRQLVVEAAADDKLLRDTLTDSLFKKEERELEDVRDDLEDQINDLEDEVEEKREEIKEKDKEISELEEKVRAQEAEMDSLDRRVSALGNKLMLIRLVVKDRAERDAIAKQVLSILTDE